MGGRASLRGRAMGRSRHTLEKFQFSHRARDGKHAGFSPKFTAREAQSPQAGVASRSYGATGDARLLHERLRRTPQTSPRPDQLRPLINPVGDEDVGLMRVGVVPV